MKRSIYIGITASIGLTSALSSGIHAQEQQRALNQSQLTEAQIDSIEAAAYGNVKDLQELVITADAPMIKASSNQITYNVNEDPAAAGNSVLDMLRKMPMVTVDGQDNIQVKGDGGFKIYVNGQPDPMLTQNASYILKAMPAESVASIELITDPGAKYDAEGTAAIINLVTDHKQVKNGYNGAVNLSVDNRQATAGINASAKIDKVNLNLGVDFSAGFPNANNSQLSDRTEYFDDPDQHFLIASGDNTQKVNYTGVNLGTSWDISEHDLFSLSTNYYKVWGDMLTSNNRSEMMNSSGETQWSYFRDSKLHLDVEGVTLTAGYQHEFGRSDHFLGVNYQFSFNKLSIPIDYTYSNLHNYTPQFIFEKNYNANYSREHTLQADYSNSLSEHSKIEAGIKGIFRRNTASGDSSGSNDGLQFTPMEGASTLLDQPQDIYSAYGLYTATYGNFTGNAGVRYEHTLMGVKYPSDPAKNFTTHLNDVVPNANISYNFSPAENLTVAYSMRIARPSIQQLNPFRLNFADTRIEEGNPNLKSERINKASISYNNFMRTLGGGISLEYSNSSNAIASVSYLDGFKIVRTYDNIGRRQESSMNIFLTWSASKKLRLSLNGGLRYTDIKAYTNHTKASTISGYTLEDISNHGFSGNVNANLNWELPEKITFSAYGGWNSGHIELMANSGDYHYYGLSLMRPFLKDDALKVTISASNCFEKYITFRNTAFGEGYRAENNWKNENWRVGIALSWDFGKTDNQVRQVNTSIYNDDLSTAKSSVGGIGGN